MRIRLLSSLCILLLAALVINSCKKDEVLMPVIDYTAIDTIHYSQHVQPILNNSCAVSGCHDGINVQTHGAGLVLTSWDELVKGSQFGEDIIPLKPARSLLVTLFDGTTLRKPHPSLGNYSLSSAEVQFLKRWISEGARNDAGLVPYRNSVHKVYVPNQAEDAVAIIDIDNLVVSKYVDVGRFPILEGPHFIAANSDYWYVSLISTGEVWKFDAHADTLVKTGTVPGAPALLALTQDGSKLYVSQFMTSSTNKVSVLNTATMTLLKTINVWTMPHGIRMNHAGTLLYVANMMSDNISVIDVTADTVVATIPLANDVNPFGSPKYMPMEVAVSPNDSLVLATCSDMQEVRMFSTSTNALVDSFHVGNQPWHLQFSPDGDFCYVTNRLGNSVSVIHIPMRHVMDTISSASPVYFDYPHGCDVSSDGKYVFVSNENSGQHFIPRYATDFVGNVCVIDRNLNLVVKVLEVGKMPTGLSCGQ